MSVPNSWKFDEAARNTAAELGETIARTLGRDELPVDVSAVIRSEAGRIQAFGDNFGDAFDGRLEYQHPHFLLFYNIKYDAWRHSGEHHPKVRFTIAHELGHYYLEDHRSYLMRGGGPHGSFTEFASERLPEREADAFAAGLLMPAYLLRPMVNEEAPTITAIRAARGSFDVSLTSMMVRWVQLSDFPCAVISIRDGQIEWGFTSEAFKNAGGYRVHRRKQLASRSAAEFLEQEPSLATYREGSGWGNAASWIEIEQARLEVHEDYVVIPSTQQLLVFLTADEDEVARSGEQNDDE